MPSLQDLIEKCYLCVYSSVEDSTSTKKVDFGWSRNHHGRLRFVRRHQEKISKEMNNTMISLKNIYKRFLIINRIKHFKELLSVRHILFDKNQYND